MSGVEAGVRIGMQDSGYGYPPVEDRSQRLPLFLCTLAATNQNVSPEPIYALSEGAQPTDIPGNSMVLVKAGTRNVRTYRDPSHAMYAERASCSGFIQTPHIPKAMHTRPNTKQIHCSITAIVVGGALFRSSSPFSLAPCPTLKVRSRPRCPTSS